MKRGEDGIPAACCNLASNIATRVYGDGMISIGMRKWSPRRRGAGESKCKRGSASNDGKLAVSARVAHSYYLGCNPRLPAVDRQQPPFNGIRRQGHEERWNRRRLPLYRLNNPFCLQHLHNRDITPPSSLTRLADRKTIPFNDVLRLSDYYAPSLKRGLFAERSTENRNTSASH